MFVARHDEAPRSAHREPVAHDYAVLAFHTAGAAWTEQAGRWSVGQGDVRIIPAGEAHAMPESAWVAGWAVGLDAACIIADGDEELLEPFERVRRGSSPVVSIPEPRRAFFESLFVELRRELDAPGDSTHALQKSLVTLIVAEVTRASERLAQGDELVEIIAERVGYADATHFTRLFRRAHGITPAAWRTRHRPPTATPRAARPSGRG